ncbi:MAG: sulfotransferase [Candidatus Thiodiazotropha sp. (ex Ctena orbiculata)]|uniref:Sulfotransferase n=1 Tax=Candidatus Thiodiazotropha taylori TaxID=2792791 RepID=A0A944MA41_9GAMM|nr:sulfotransferase [Candidatus Thiodiazotropha taylori]MBV2135675.1 sulfotransferase [Candidatus Thiodiazotropha taylori]
MPKKNGEHILVTGCYRSGTTIVEKIINMHPKATIASQPFPILFFIFKEQFNEIRGIKRRYPLDHLFLETNYKNQDFVKFIQEYSIDKKLLSEFQARMRDYTEGLWTPGIIEVLDQLQPGTFFDIYKNLLHLIATMYSANEDNLVGSKEVLIEEYTPAMIEMGVKVIFVVRDPRDMITSLNFRIRDNRTGENRPILYSLRAWRKSVAFAYAAATRKEGCLVRYEDLVSSQWNTINTITHYLGIEEFKDDAFDDGIVDQNGKGWKGNSSFTDQNGISGNSLHKYKKYLPQDIRKFIEVVCAPEMRLLGYISRARIDEVDDVIESYRDPFESSHSKFKQGYSHTQDRLKREKERLILLKKGIDDADKQRQWFIAPEIYSAMSSMNGQNGNNTDKTDR